MARVKILTFLVKDRHFALPSGNIKEITESGRNLKKIFYDRGGALKGLMSYEGDMISVLNTPLLLEIDKEAGAATEPLVLVSKEFGSDRPIGLLITSIVGMEIIEDTSLKHSHDEAASYTHGFIKEGKGDKQRVVTLLDLSKFLEYSSAKISKLEGSAHSAS